MIVLDRNPFQMPRDEISAIGLVESIVAGETVYPNKP